MFKSIIDSGCTLVGNSYDIAVARGVSACPPACRCDACTGVGSGPRDAIAFCGRQIDNRVLRAAVAPRVVRGSRS